MTLVTGTVQDLGYDGMEGTLWARPARFRSDGSVVLAPERKPFKITGGVVSAELAPGPAVLEIQVGSHARGTFEVVIPEEDTTLADLLDTVFPWEPEQVSVFVAAREAAEQAKADAETAAQVAEGHRQYVDSIRETLDEAAQGNVAPYLTQTALNATYATKSEVADAASEVTAAFMPAMTSVAAPPSRWWVHRRSMDALNFTGQIGGGRFWTWALMRDNSNPGGFRTCMTGNYSNIGVPMIYAHHTEGVYTGAASWFRYSQALGPNSLALPGLIAGGTLDLEVTTTAGDNFVYPTVDPTLVPDRGGHGIVIYGAGAGGTDLVARINNQNTAGRIALYAADVPQATGTFQARIYPAYTASPSSDATATATYNTPPGSTRAGVSLAPGPAGGIWKVTVNGSNTAANMALTGRELLARGYVTEADMSTSGGPIEPGHRYIDSHFSQGGLHRPVGIATGLAPGVHTIVLSATGVGNPLGVNVRAFISGFAYGDETTMPDTPGADIYGQFSLIPEESAIEFAHQIVPATGGTGVFIGSQHGFENQIGDLAVEVDGETVPLDVGGAVTGTSVKVVRTSQLHHPEATGHIADVTYSWTCTAGRPLVAAHRMTWAQNVDVVAGYPVHCNLDSAEMPNCMGDVTAVPETLTDFDNSYKALAQNRAIATWGSSVLFVENVPAVEAATGGWSSLSMLHSIRDREGGVGRRWGKTYMSRIGVQSSGSTWAASAEYSAGLTYGDFSPPA